MKIPTIKQTLKILYNKYTLPIIIPIFVIVGIGVYFGEYNFVYIGAVGLTSFGILMGVVEGIKRNSIINFIEFETEVRNKILGENNNE